MLLSKVNENEITDTLINKVLYEVPCDNKKTGRCILVLGAGYDEVIEERVNIAIKLYNAGRAKKILLSGGIGKNGQITEAAKMKENLINNNISLEDILIEDKSKNTSENIIYSKEILENNNLFNGNLIIVTSQIHVRRVILTLSKYINENITYSFCYNNLGFASEEHFKTDDYIKEYSKNEIRKIIEYIKKGYIDDFELK